MGFFNYIRPTKPVPKGVVEILNEKEAAAAPSSPPSLADSHTHSYASSRDDSKFVLDIRHDVIVNYLYQKQCTSMWIEDTSGAREGVLVKKSKADYLCCPPMLAHSPFAQAMTALNVQAAMTIKSRVVSTFCQRAGDAYEIPIRDGLRIQVLRNMSELARARKHQYAAFITSESALVVWDDDPSHLIKRIEGIENDLLRIVWLSGRPGFEKECFTVVENEIDPETGLLAAETRPTMYYHAFYTMFSLGLAVFLLGLGWREIIVEIVQLKKYTSLALLCMAPIEFFLALFFCITVVSIIAQAFGPVKQMHKNSKFFSGSCVPRLQTSTLPHVTIQMPVYKEGLAAVIEPTVRSLKQAISTYELQGGTANILINDDGLQLISEQDREARVTFYTDNNIGWTARPKHDPKGTGFVRPGKFKKASNMNYGLDLCNRVEAKLQAIERHNSWTQIDEDAVYETCLQAVLDDQAADVPRGWAAGNIRVGDYILIIDSDTRVPSDCFLDAVSEMETSPDVAIIQFSSGVMQVAHDFFENGITYFTNMIYTAIRFGVSNGDVAPFVGHNAIMRWSAVQQVSFQNEQGVELFWSESTVSEDFEMALRLQIAGYLVRFASWAGDGFKEGVSLTVYDELTRWEKYAYGCNELVFNPVKTWLWKGPITPLFRKFLGSCMPTGSKLNIVAYIGTYYAIGSAWIFTLANYVAVGLYNGYLDRWYVESWKIWVSVVVVFCCAGNVALAVQRYRIGERDSIIGALWENFKWALMFVVFFGGLSMHLSQAILCHMFGIDMSWGATSKEVENTNFFKEVPKVFGKFKWSMLFNTFLIVAIVVMAVGPFIPWSWNITEFVAIFPLCMIAGCHILLPIVLNPGLMTFTW